MKIIYSPSAKRMIPYPPVGPAVLASILKDNHGIMAEVIDLEMALWKENDENGDVLLYREGLSSDVVLNKSRVTEEVVAYQNRLVDLISYKDGEAIALSIMGYEQLASAILLAEACLERGSPVIMGGQYWREKNSGDILTALGSLNLTIVIGDGWQAIQEWATDKQALPTNSMRWDGTRCISGCAGNKAISPPRPNYDTVNWNLYNYYAKNIYKDDRQLRRAHLYVWDKQCPYKCNFCRVSTGSKAKLSPVEKVAQDFENLLNAGVSQFNFMTNELNPTLKYLRRFLDYIKPVVEENNFERPSWFTYLRPDHIELEDFQRLRAVGCRLVRYGVETGSQSLSDRMQKDYKIETIEKVLKYASASDILNHVNFLIGYPGETEKEFNETLEFVERNHKNIHSVRINPFYLPPDTPMSREPDVYGIKLISFERGYWDFDLIKGGKNSSELIKNRIEVLTELLMSKNVGFSAVLPFATLNELSKFNNRDDALENMRSTHSYMWEYSSPDTLKSILGGYNFKDGWDNTIYKRGRNYQMTICND